MPSSQKLTAKLPLHPNRRLQGIRRGNLRAVPFRFERLIHAEYIENDGGQHGNDPPESPIAVDSCPGRGFLLIVGIGMFVFVIFLRHELLSVSLRRHIE